MKAKCNKCGHEADVPKTGAGHRRCPGSGMGEDKKPTRDLRSRRSKLSTAERGTWTDLGSEIFKVEEAA